jgi:hypothetical protein
VHTVDETWFSFVNVKAKEQSAVKAVDAHAFTKQVEKFKHLPARKLMASVSWDRTGVLMVEFVQQGTTRIMSDVYCKKLKDCVRPFRMKARNAEIWCTVPP